MSTITINGNSVTICGSGNVVINGKGVYVDGKKCDEFDFDKMNKNIEVYITGPINNLEAAGSVNCQEVKGNIDAGGSVTVSGNANGDIDAGGSVTVGGNVDGDVDAGGSVHIGRR